MSALATNVAARNPFAVQVMQEISEHRAWSIEHGEAMNSNCCHYYDNEADAEEEGGLEFSVR
jgi:hypothetical protein